MQKLIFSIVFIIISHAWTIGQPISIVKYNSKLQKKAYLGTQKFIDEKLNSNQSIFNPDYSGRGKIEIDTLVIAENEKTIHLYLNKYIGEYPLRNETIKVIISGIQSYLSSSLKKFELNIYSDSVEIHQYIPNYFRGNKEIFDLSRLPQKNNIRPERKNFVEAIKPYEITNGLQNSNIALWGSHGWYYESKLDRWEWQRARLFTTVEDLLPTSFVIPYIIPMLNNSGAYLLTPRERDIQTNELIVDNDSIGNSSLFRFPEFMERSGKSTGYAFSKNITEDINPFKKGTFISGTANNNDSIEWIPEFKESGNYQVYVSYGHIKNASKLKYRINYSGGYQDYIVDQSIGFGTWIPLGNHYFTRGMSQSNGKLVLYIEKGQTASADAAKFGGGIGNTIRNGQISGKPRFMESPRCYLQYSGFSDSLIWKQNSENKDYVDNYISQGEWVNYLIGNPFGPKKDTASGIGIPIDLALAFHTDAGILGSDSTVGSLGIYSTSKNNGFFADGQSRYASRDMTDMIQSQIVDDIRLIYNKKWTRRGMWNAQYSEAFRPNVPTMLLELLSHQNPNDMKLALDPNFRFDVSRAIYKGILRFLAFQNKYDYVVQPLPVNHFKAELIDKNRIKLSWKAVDDPIEPTAKAQKFIVYTRIANQGFDQGKITDSNELIINNIESNKIYSYKVTAINQGGESFPSEILSVGFSSKSDSTVLIVNGFDRLEGPEFIKNDSFTGFMRPLDQGVPYLYDFSTTGNQFNFNPKAPWLDDDSPGFGASYADEENLIYPGNTFDFPLIHGQAILNNGYSFISMSKLAFENLQIKKGDYMMVDFIMGEEKTKQKDEINDEIKFRIFTEKFIEALENINKNEISVFISGSYIGTDIGNDTLLIKKVGETLGYSWRTDHAVKNGDFHFIDKSENESTTFSFVTKFDKKIYPAESPDAIEPYNDKSKVIIRYSENNMSAGVFSDNLNKVVSFGFPFECISNTDDQNKIMKTIIKLLK